MAKVKRTLELPEELVRKLTHTTNAWLDANAVLTALKEAGIDTTSETSINALTKAAETVTALHKEYLEAVMEVTMLARTGGYNPGKGDSPIKVERVASCGVAYWIHDDADDNAATDPASEA